VVYRVRTRKRCLYLTFDDGIHPEHTPMILDCLKAASAQATFFIIGNTTAGYSDLLKRMLMEGHAIGSHTQSHRDLSEAAPDEIAREIDESLEVLESACERQVNALRPPWGRFKWGTVLAAMKRNFPVILWSVDSLDWKFQTPGALLEHLKGIPFSPGDILLLHDDYAHTVQALPELLSHLTEQGWRCRALPLPHPALETERETLVPIY
jgi:peptidoglycan/xylan/chitin deacetylase (PgdA/CDA1 family)